MDLQGLFIRKSLSNESGRFDGGLPLQPTTDGKYIAQCHSNLICILKWTGRSQGWLRSNRCENEIFRFQASVKVSRHVQKKKHPKTKTKINISKMHCKKYSLATTIHRKLMAVYICASCIENVRGGLSFRLIFSLDPIPGDCRDHQCKSMPQITNTDVADSVSKQNTMNTKTQKIACI